MYGYFPFDRVYFSVTFVWRSWLQQHSMGEIAYSFYPSLVIVLAILGTSFTAAKVTIYGVFIYVLQYSLGDEIKKNVLGGARDTFGRRGWGVYRVLVSRPEGKRPLGRPRLDERVILKWVFK